LIAEDREKPEGDVATFADSGGDIEATMGFLRRLDARWVREERGGGEAAARVRLSNREQLKAERQVAHVSSI
jgi:hypothetical protein